MLQTITKMHSQAQQAKKISGPPGKPEKLKVNCLVVPVKIMFKWYNNVVATNIAD